MRILFHLGIRVAVCAPRECAPLFYCFVMVKCTGREGAPMASCGTMFSPHHPADIWNGSVPAQLAAMRMGREGGLLPGVGMQLHGTKWDEGSVGPQTIPGITRQHQSSLSHQGHLGEMRDPATTHATVYHPEHPCCFDECLVCRCIDAYAALRAGARLRADIST